MGVKTAGGAPTLMGESRTSTSTWEQRTSAQARHRQFHNPFRSILLCLMQTSNTSSLHLLHLLPCHQTSKIPSTILTPMCSPRYHHTHHKTYTTSSPLLSKLHPLFLIPSLTGYHRGQQTLKEGLKESNLKEGGKETVEIRKGRGADLFKFLHHPLAINRGLKNEFIVVPHSVKFWSFLIALCVIFCDIS